jgi:hypothetical protein
MRIWSWRQHKHARCGAVIAATWYDAPDYGFAAIGIG